MKRLLPALCAGLLAANAFAGPRKGGIRPPWSPPEDDLPAEEDVQIETWSSFAMEAKAISGEVRLQGDDVRGAKDSYRESLDKSLDVNNPHSQLMGLDLFRSAQFAAAEEDYVSARRYLYLIISRYPDSQWADKARRLMATLPAADGQEPEEEPATPVIVEHGPELELARIQTALKEDRPQQALAETRRFIGRHGMHPAVEELSLLEGALELRLGNPAAARKSLAPVAEKAKSDGVASKASYLLAAANYQLKDYSALRDSVRDTGDKWSTLSQAWLAAADDAEGDADSAVKRYRRVADSGLDSPLKATALAAVAAGEDRAGRHGAAAGLMSRAVLEADKWGLDQLGIAARLSAGHIQYKARKYQDAARSYADFSRHYADHPLRVSALFYRGLALKRSGLGATAVQAFQELLEGYPKSKFADEANLQLGQLYSELGQDGKAAAHYERISDEREAMLLAAQVHYNNKRFKTALPYYQEFLAKYPSDPKASEVQNLMLTSYWLGDRDSPELVDAVAKYPRHPIVANIRWELGRRAFQKGDFASAEEQFRRLGTDFPNSPNLAESLFFRAESLTKLGDNGVAVQVYKDLAQRFPQSPQARQASFKLGNALFEAGDYEASEAAYKQSEKGGDALSADALFNRALAASRAGKRESSLKLFEQLMTRFPKYERAAWVWFQIGNLRESVGKVQGAISAYRRVTGENRTQALFKIGRCHEGLKQRPLARSAYERLMEARPTQDPYRLHGLLRLALIYELENKAIKAMPIYASLIRLGKGTSVSETARKRMQALTAEKAASASQ